MATGPISSSYDSLVLSHQPKHYFQHVDGDTWIDAVAGKNGTFPEGFGMDVVRNGERIPHFNGLGQYATMGDSSYFGPAGAAGYWTVECWFRPDVLTFPRWQSSGYVEWMGKGTWHDYTDGDREWTARMYNEANDEDRPNWISGYTVSYNGGTGLAAGQAFTGGVEPMSWHHFVYITDHVNRRVGLWLDGVQALSWVGMDAEQYQIEIRNGTAPLNVGTQDHGSYLQGCIGKLAFYTGALSQARITEHYEASPLHPDAVC